MSEPETCDEGVVSFIKVKSFFHRIMYGFISWR